MTANWLLSSVRWSSLSHIIFKLPQQISEPNLGAGPTELEIAIAMANLKAVGTHGASCGNVETRAEPEFIDPPGASPPDPDHLARSGSSKAAERFHDEGDPREKGETECRNHHGISQGSHTSKVLLNVVARRLGKCCERKGLLQVE